MLLFCFLACEAEEQNKWATGQWPTQEFTVQDLQAHAWETWNYEVDRAHVYMKIMERMRKGDDGVSPGPPGPDKTTLIIEFPYWPSNGKQILDDLNDAGFTARWKLDSRDGLVGMVISWPVANDIGKQN